MDRRRRRERQESGIEAQGHTGRKFEDFDDDCSHTDEQSTYNFRQNVNEERTEEPKEFAQDDNRLRVVQRCVVRLGVGKEKPDNASGPFSLVTCFGFFVTERL
jgi:hypothetical protein